MKMDIIASSKNDEFYTPEYAICPIIKYIPKDAIVWCPFDTYQSNFVKIMANNNIRVVHTHISEGYDFFKTDIPHGITHIISNPPYSLKGKVVERLFNLGNPFAMLVGVVGLFESKTRFDIFKNNSFEIMYMSKRISYFKDFKEQKPSLNPPFSSVYICHKMLPKQIIFEEIVK